MKQLHRLIPLILIFVSSSAYAQIVGSNCFLQGCYIEIGLSDCGVYGTSTLPPAAGGLFGPYHPNVGSYFGFVADHQKDGWAVGSPNYCGDYFVPGSPVEGWQIQSGVTVYTNSDVGCWENNIPGSVVGYTDTGGYKSATWEGSIAAINLEISQKTVFPDGALFFLTSVTLCNTGATDLYNTYYKRNVDPDQDQPWSGDFTTTNIIVSNPPVGDTALVTAEGLTYGCFLGIGAIDPRARTTWGNFSTSAGTPLQAYTGVAGYSLTSTMTSDIAIQITFKIDTIAAGECTTINFAHVLDPSDLDEALQATLLGSIGVTADSVVVDTNGIIQLCLGDSVELEILYGEDYDWTWTPSAGLSTDTGIVVMAFPDSTTTYQMTGIGECATLYREITVEIFDLAGFADAGPDMSVCLGDTVALSGSGGDFYTWSPPSYLSDQFVPAPLVQNPLTNMFYTLVVKNDLGCSDTDEVQVFLYDNPIIEAGDDQYMVKGGFTTLSASGGVSYTWTPTEFITDPFATTTTAFPDDTTLYYVTGIDANGCIGYDSMTVFVLEQTVVISPTAFTPNGDGLNDTWKPVLIGLGEITGFSIYNRWGDLIFEASDVSVGWDGRFRALEQEIGNYVVVVHALDAFGVEIIKSSMVLLMR